MLTPPLVFWLVEWIRRPPVSLFVRKQKEIGMKNIILILTTLMFFSCYSSKVTQPPKWIDLNDSDKIIEKIGVAESKHESILNAMYELSSFIKTEVKSKIIDSTYVNKLDFHKERRSSHSSETLFGKVKITGLTKDFSEEVGVGDSIEVSHYFESVIELTFTDGNKNLIYKNYFSKSWKTRLYHVGDGKNTVLKHHFEITEDNCTLKDLIEELNDNGCEFEFFSDNDNHYTLVRYEKERLLENIQNHQ